MLFLEVQVSGMSLSLLRQFPTATTVNLGGGYKASFDVYDSPSSLDLDSRSS